MDEKSKKAEEKVESKEKIILVDAVHCLVDEEGNVNGELKNYLDSIKNKKIVLTNAPKEKHKQFFKNIKDYEIFTLENNPSKKDSNYYRRFLDKFSLNSKQVIYFEHDEENIKSAKSVGIKTIHYKNNVKEIIEFIEKSTKKTKEDSEETKKTEEKPVEKKEEKIKKTNAFVNATSLPISTKHSIAVCKFIKGKKIEKAIDDLEKVGLLKKAVPMKGEIPHRKGMMSGRYPKKASEYFIKLLKSLSANANVNGLENSVISEAIANLASRPYSKFGRVRKKRTHVKIVVTQNPTALMTKGKSNQVKGKNVNEVRE